MRLGPVELERYFSPGVKSGRFSVFGRITEAQVAFDGKTPVPARLREATLEKIVDWCGNAGKIRYSDLLKKQLGQLPVGVTEQSTGMNDLLYLYNPDNLPGLSEIRADESGRGGMAVDPFATLLSIQYVTIDNERYALPLGSLSAADWEPLQ